MMKRLLIGIVCLLVVACAREREEEDLVLEPTSGTEMAEVTTGEIHDDDPDPNMLQVNVSLPESEPLRMIATVPDECEDPSVYFEVDSARLTKSAQTELDELAMCLRGVEVRSITLEGHADPRGTDEYNRTLARERAVAVEQYLRDAGVTDARVEIDTMGEAQSRNRIYWPEDRRVDIEVEEGS